MQSPFRFLRLFACCISIALTSISYGQLTVNTAVTSAQLISSLAGQGLTVSNVQLNCPTGAYGTFANGNTTNMGLTNGILLTTGSATNAIGPNNSTSLGTCNGTSGSDPQLITIDPQATQDLCVLEFDIVPQCNQLTIRFVFGSEEYPEFVNSSFNDAFGFFITGPGPACQSGFYNNTNVATLPNNVTPVSIDNVSPTTNTAYYVNNTGGTTIQYDGFTTVLTRTINICPCQTYHFKLAIADAGDCYYDSGVFVDFLSCTSVLAAAPTSTPSTTCVGCNGTLAANASGGVAPYTYSWSPGGWTTATVNNVCPGTYTVTVNDTYTCTPAATAVVTVTSTVSTLTVTATQTNVLCNGQCTGTASVAVSGGSAPYTYSWAPSGGNAATATGLCAGTYTVSITDATGCNTTRTFTITQPPALTATQTQTNVLCNGQCTGAASVTPSGGTAPYTYSWAPSGGTASSTTGRCAGTYTVTITDANGCTTTRSFNITQPPALTTTGTQTNVLCNGGLTGSASVTPSGGTAPYTYSWAPSGGTGSTATGLGAGTYTVTVTDANGCTTTRTYSITQPPALTATQTQTNILCNGLCTGAASVTPSGGTAPYTYSWAPSGGTASSTTGRCAGTYTVTITDANGCTTTRTFNITQPPAITTTGTQTNVLCNGGNTGSASVTASGGTAPYTYSWAPSGGTGSTATGLGAGTYTVTVTDANGCTSTRTYTITQPPALTTTGTQTNVLCNGGLTGSASVTPSGGTAPYTYSWAPSGGTGSTATGLGAGTYTVTVTDANGCTTTRTYSITQPPALTATQTQTNILCNGLCTGAASVTPSGGTAPYTYSWAPSGGTASLTTGRCAGTYSVTITDANGCTTTRTFNITQPPAITTTGTQTNVLCNGGLTGSASVTASGGTAPYTYSWAPSGGTGSTATGLGAGTYTVTVTDANGCTTTRTYSITQPPALTASTSTTPATCGNPNGSATATPSGGVGPYTYSWAPSGGNAATATGLLAGTYTVTITDANGCTTTASATVINSGGPTASISTIVNVSCFGGTNGSATSTMSGGTGPFTYAWAPSGGTGATATGLGAGTYTVTITDANGCTAQATATITQPPAITTTGTQTNVLCNGALTGSASVTASGGTAPYTYSWAPSGGTGSTVTGLGAGTYTVTVTDANGCTSTRTYTITQPPAITTTGTQTNVLCNGGLTGSASVTASGGTAPYTYSWAPSGGTGSTATGLGAGTYTVTVTDANGCTTTRTYSITQPPALTASTSTTPATCGNPNGSATATPSGGVGPYTYSWAPSGGNAATATGLLAGTYTVTITDANGCTTTASATVTNAGSPTATISASTNISCFGGNNGSATVSASGGTGPYTYAWTPSGGTGTTASGLVAGSYTVTVTDANGCTAQATVTLTQPPALTATATNTAVLCFGGNTGSAAVSASGGTAPYTYSWAPSGGTGATATGLTAGAYTVTITDANGCTTTASTTITQPPALTATTTTTAVLCFGGNTGAAAVTASGGVAPYSYAWAPSGGNSANATGLTAGSYTVTITDANGCTTTASATVTQPPQLTVAVTTTPSTCGNANGSAVATETGGTGPYTYLWTPNNTTSATLSNVVAGSYQITVTDANGCTASAIATVNNMGNPVASIVASDSVSCFGGNDGFAAAGASSGTGPYTFTWSNADNDSLAGGLTAGSYTVTVTDANGCTDTASVIIYEPLQLTATTTQVDVLCFGNSTGSATVTASGGTGAYSYSWAPPGGNTDTASSLPAGSYTCTITDANGCTTTASVTITEPPQLTATATSTDVSCFAGTDGTATATETGGTAPYSYAWAPTGGNSAAAAGLAAGTYTCTITDNNGCTTTASVTITEPTPISITTTAIDANCNQADGSATATATGGTGAFTYNWLPSGSGSAINNVIAGTYTVIATDANGCADTTTVVIGNLNGVNATLAASSNISCFGGADGSIDIDATGGTGPYTYNWLPNVSASDLASGIPAGSYQITVTDVNGCTSVVNVTLTQPPALTITATATPTVVCEGTHVTLSATPTGGTPAYTVTWNPGNLSGNNQTITPTQSGAYTADVTDANGCTASTVVNITVNPMPTANLSADITSGCAPLCVNFSDLSTALAPTVITGWLWDFGDGNTSNQQNPSHCFDDPGNYTVTLNVTTGAGCSANITMANYINVFANPVAAFGASPQPTTILNPTIFFTDSSSNAVQWNWSFGDLANSSSSDQNPQFTYPDPTCYSVLLTVTSADGCQDTASQIVCIDPDVSIYVPNTFTPNEDGRNEVFFPVAIGIDPNHFEMWIFDRWGNMIYYTDDINDGWDGRVQGASEVAQIDTYVWKIKAKDILGKKHDLIGHVNLIK